MGKPQVKANFSALPTEVCEKLGITQETFVKELVEISITNTGCQNPQHLVRFYCNDCQKNLLPKLLSNSKYGTFKTIEELFYRKTIGMMLKFLRFDGYSRLLHL